MARYDPPGVYFGKNLMTGKVYVGSARRIYSRIGAHKHNLKHGKHINKHLQSSWKKHGSNNFEWDVLEIIKDPKDKEYRLQREQHWIVKLRASNPDHGYNILHSVRSLAPAPLRSKISKEIWLNPVTLESMRQKSKAMWLNPEYKGKMTLVSLDQWKDPKRRKRHAARLKKRWKDPKQRKELQTRNKVRWSKPSERKKHSDAIKAKWEDPVYRAKQKKILQERWKDPEFRRKRAATFAAKRAARKQVRNEIV